MPFCEPFNNYYNDIYKPALESFGYEVKRGDDFVGPELIISDVQRAIWEADLIVCDISEQNPNVLYELGLAHAIGKPVILTSRKSGEKEIPFYFKPIRILLYEDDGKEKKANWKFELRERLMKTIRAIEVSDEFHLVLKEDYSSEKPEDKYGELGKLSRFSMLHSFFPPLLYLFRIRYQEKVEIIIPGYPNIKSYPKFVNYPMHEFESAFDDVYCTFRILPALELYSGFRNVQWSFDQEVVREELNSCPNLILIGSSVSNRYTEQFLDIANAYFKFGQKNTDSDHDIVDPSGRVCHKAEVDQLNVHGDTNKLYFKKDYALLSVLNVAGSSKNREKQVIVLAGCRAFGQVGLGEFLTDSEKVKILVDFIPRGDYQCIIGFNIHAKRPAFDRIEQIYHRSNRTQAWRKLDVVSLNEKMT